MVALSIIIPVYNTVKYLSSCLDSLLQQNAVSFELLLIDDGSNDGSGEICDKYAQADNRVRVFHQSNKGASTARNVGLEEARGEWISFVDADDWVAANYLEIFRDFAPQADITFFPCLELFQNGSSKVRRVKNALVKNRLEIEKIILELKYGNLGDIFGWTFAKFIRSSIIRDNHIRFIPELIFREDEIFTMDVCRYVSSVQVLDTPVYNYRILDTGLTSKGMQPTDYLLLANNIERNLSYFSCKDFLKEERSRIANYRLAYFQNQTRIRNLHKTMKECCAFFSEKPEFVQYASNERLASIMAHSYPFAYFLLLIDMLLRAVLGKIR